MRPEPDALHGSKTKLENAASWYQEAIPYSHKADYTRAKDAIRQCNVRLFDSRTRIGRHDRKRMLCDQSGGVRGCTPDSAAMILDFSFCHGVQHKVLISKSCYICEYQ